MKNILYHKILFFLPAIAISTIAPVSGQVHRQPSGEEVSRIHERALTVDTHCDTPMNMVERGTNIGIRNTSGKVDLPRMKEGGLDAIFFAAFTGQKERNEANYREAYQLANEMIDTTKAAVERYSDLAEIAVTAGDAARIEKAGKRAIYIGMENGFPLAQEIGRVEEFYKKGYATSPFATHLITISATLRPIPKDLNTTV